MSTKLLWILISTSSSQTYKLEMDKAKMQANSFIGVGQWFTPPITELLTWKATIFQILTDLLESLRPTFS